jgi:hypothetical protein
MQTCVKCVALPLPAWGLDSQPQPEWAGGVAEAATRPPRAGQEKQSSPKTAKKRKRPRSGPALLTSPPLPPSLFPPSPHRTPVVAARPAGAFVPSLSLRRCRAKTRKHPPGGRGRGMRAGVAPARGCMLNNLDVSLRSPAPPRSPQKTLHTHSPRRPLGRRRPRVRQRDPPRGALGSMTRGWGEEKRNGRAVANKQKAIAAPPHERAKKRPASSRARSLRPFPQTNRPCAPSWPAPPPWRPAPPTPSTCSTTARPRR